MDPNFIRDGLSAISQASGTLTGWSLSILGATVVGIVGSGLHNQRPTLKPGFNGRK